MLVLAALLVFGLFVFTIRYISSGENWVQYPVNQHLYKNGELINAGEITDRNGEILARTVDEERKFNDDRLIRTAVMHAIGDINGNVSTGAQVIYRKKLSGWDLLNGVYRFDVLRTTGMDIALTLDAELCAVAYQAMNGRKGTVGVMNYKTGEVLCMVSLPSFDPSDPPDVNLDLGSYEGVYLNRLLSVSYTPGSVFKLVTAAAAIEKLSDIDSRIFSCDGFMEISGVRVTCPSKHGDITFEEALADSCNVTFAQITLELSGTILQDYAERAGITASVGFDGIRTKAGNVDCINAEGADLAWAGIGQYTDMVNPFQFLTYMGAIANGGVLVSPHILSDNGLLSRIAVAISKNRIMPGSTAEHLTYLMRNNVVSNYGEQSYGGLELCAKSGTGEVGGGRAPNAWFAGFLNREDCPLAFVVVIENGGSGSAAAGPVAAKVLQAAVNRLTGGQ